MLRRKLNILIYNALFGSIAAIVIGATASADTDPLTSVPLNTLWRISFGPDYATTPNPSERDAHATDGAMFYVPAGPNDSSNAPIAGVAPLYRLLNKPADTDHMDSPIAGEGGYSIEGILGYPWAASTFRSGLAPINRVYDNQTGNYRTGDHALIVSADALHVGETFNYFVVEAPMGYGYARYLNNDQILAPVTGGGIRVNSNIATGGAVWEWWWNGYQFINDYDYGRQLTSAFYDNSHSRALQEAGDQYGGPAIPVYARHSSPTASVTTSANIQSTRSIPLDWEPENFGGSIDHPVIYPDVQIGKNLTLDWIGPDKIERNWPVAQYEAVYSGPTINEAVVEAPTAYLNSAFNVYYRYDPVSDQLQPISVPTDSPASINVPESTLLPGANALIIANGTGMNAVAMGVYKNDPNAGMVFYDNTSGASPGQYGSNFSKWEVHYDSGISDGWTFRTWIATDSVSNIVQYFRQLYSFGVMSRDRTPPQSTNLIDPQFYIDIYPDLAGAFGAESYGLASVHWQRQGLPNEGRRGGPAFDPVYYLNSRADLQASLGGARAFQQAATYWTSAGLSNGDRASLEFDPIFYLNHYPDLQLTYVSSAQAHLTNSNSPSGFQALADHWRTTGLPLEGRAGSAEFDVSCYIRRYADLAAVFGATSDHPALFQAALIHWLVQGKAEGRTAPVGSCSP